MDISTLSIDELKDLQKRIPGEIQKREEDARKRTLDEIRTFAEAKGYSLDQLLKVLGKKSDGKATRVGRVVPVKYRHPEQISLTWTGRGRKPQWVQAWLDAGQSLDALKV